MVEIKASEIYAGSNEQVFEILSKELDRILPRADDHSAFINAMQNLPTGLRAMAATYELDVSLTLDDFGWHFGNWHSKELAQETATGLEELGAIELASLFREAFTQAQLYWSELDQDNWMDWYHGSELEKAVDPLNNRAWDLLRDRWHGIFSYWVEYARRYPEKIGVKKDD